MEQNKLNQFKEILLKEKTRLEEELSKFTRPDTGNADNFNAQFPEFGSKDDENAAEIADYTVSLPLEQTLEKQLKDVNSSLKRIEEKTYGICKYCGKPIEEKRLEARSTSSACISCKKQLTQEV